MDVSYLRQELVNIWQESRSQSSYNDIMALDNLMMSTFGLAWDEEISDYR